MEGLGGGPLTGGTGMLGAVGRVESGNAEWLNGREEEYPVGWKGDTTKVTGVNQVALLWVVESFESV